MNSRGSLAWLLLCDQQLFAPVGNAAAGTEHAKAEHYYGKRAFFEATLFSCQGSTPAATLCSKRIHATLLQWQVWVRWSLCSQSRNLPLVKLLPPFPVCLLNGFSLLPSGAGTAEYKLWDCCIMHIDGLLTFPIRLRKLINLDGLRLIQSLLKSVINH